MANFVGQWLYEVWKPKRGSYVRKNALTYAHFKSWSHCTRKHRKGPRKR